jgi:hypothetical protein
MHQFIAHRLVMSLMFALTGNMLMAQAFNEEEITARDYVPSIGNVAENDILPAGLPTFQFINNPRYGNIEWIDTSGTFSYLVDPDNIRMYARDSVWANRRDTAIYEVCIGNFCDTALIPIWLSHQNDNPTPLPDYFYVEEGQSRLINFGVNDTDPDSISDPVSNQLYWFYYTSPTNGVISNFSVDGYAVYTPNPGFSGTDNFLYEVQDHCGLFAYTSITITTTGNNDNPIANPISLVNLLEDTISIYQISGAVTDPENDPLTFAIVEQPVNGYAWINGSGILSFMPSNNFIGPDTLYYEVTDLVGQTDTAAITLNVVNANNDEPAAPQQSFITSEDLVLNTSIAFEDVIDGDVLTYSIVDNPQNGTASITSSGTLLYTPYLNFAGTDELTYRSCDAGNLCSTASITILINPVNDAPLVLDDTNELPINGSLISGLQPNVSDIDSPLNLMTFLLINSATNGNLALDSNGSYTYTPNEYFYGDDGFTYTVCDNAGGCSIGSVAITVTLVNLPPEAENTSFTVEEDSETTLALDAYTFDFGSSDLFYSILGTPAIGAFTSITNEGLHFQPQPNLYGNYTLSYRVCDTGNLCDTAQIEINILPVNDAPQALNAFYEGNEDSMLNWQAQYSDIDGDSLSFTIIQSPLHGILEGNTYMPNTDYNGEDSFTYQVCDEYGACDEGTFSLSITPINDSPMAIADVIEGTEDNWVTGSVSGNDFDIDSPVLDYFSLEENNPYNVSLAVDGSFTWLPPANFSGSVVFEYRVCDNQGLCDTAIATIHVAEVNDIPLVNFPSLLMEEDGQAEYTAIYYAFDSEGQSIQQSIVSAQGVQVVLNPASGFLQLDAATNYFGPAMVVLNTCDAVGGCSTDTLFIEIQPVNDGPYGFDSDFTTFQNTTVSGSWYNYVFDVDDDVFSFSAVTSIGSVTTEESGIFNYSPLENFLGFDTIWVQACDSSNVCAALQFIVEVLPPNQSPIVTNAERTICQGSFSEIMLTELAADEVDAAENLQYSFLSSVNSTFVIDAQNQWLLITPSAFFTGEMSILFEVCDNATPSLCSEGTITLNVTPTVTPEITAVSVHAISCFGLNDGSIVIESVSDNMGAIYLWENSGTDSAIYDLSPGAYSVEIIGLSECSTSTVAQFIITEPDQLSVSLNTSNSGLIESTVTGGTAPYNYQWQGPDNFSANTTSISDLNAAGQYSLIVTDANGCATETSALINPITFHTSESISVYPNPSGGEDIIVLLPSDVHAGCQVRFVDSMGKSVFVTTTNAERFIIPTGMLSSGIYYLIISGSSKHYHEQIVIEH